MKHTALLALAILTTSTADWAHAQQQQPLKVAVTEIAPYGFIKDGKDQGIYLDMTKAICERAGLSCVHTIVPYARAKSEVLNGTSDMTTMFPNDEMTAANTKTAKLVYLNTIIVGKKGVEFADQKALHGKVVATLRGSAFEESFHKNNKIIKYPAKDYNEGARLLFSGRVDAIVGSEYGVYFSAQQEGYKRADFGKPLLIKSQYAWLMSAPKSSADMKKAVSDAVSGLINDGTFDKIVKKYVAD